MTRLALDTSAAIPLLVRTHRAHADVVRWWSSRQIWLSGHAAVETYAVLTRLPGDLRVAPADAARLIGTRFAGTLTLAPAITERIHATLAELGIAGAAAYDALVALAAREHGAVLVTRDARARATYEAIGVAVEIAAR